MNFFQIMPEERALENLFGKDYRTYTDEFDVWLQQSNSELYKILEPIYDSKIKKAG